MLQPTEQWLWKYNQVKNQLTLDLDSSMAFTTAYQHKHLTDDVLVESSFNLDDARYYQEVVAALVDTNRWSKPQAVQIALNATAAHRFYKPTMPKSWFFKTNRIADPYARLTSEDGICLLYTDYGCAQFLMVDQGEKASSCMLLDSELPLNETRTMNQFEIIKVMNDRQFGRKEFQQLKYA
ncbi:MAG: cell division protein ZapC [Alteromonadaceae bacterium]|jgi:cell division protein ZapC